MDKSGLTARPRSVLSVPMAYLHKQGLIVGDAIDYGCGRGSDATRLKMARYDPYWHPDLLAIIRKYDTVTCHYVLNVIKEEYERGLVLVRIKELLKPGGKAYISVRADVKHSGYTGKGTWQGNIFLNLPLIKSTVRYRIYLLAPDIA